MNEPKRRADFLPAYSASESSAIRKEVRMLHFEKKQEEFGTFVEFGRRFEAPIKIVGVGGGGLSVLDCISEKNSYIDDYIQVVGVDTDLNALLCSKLEHKGQRIQIGGESLNGAGTGKNPELGLLAAEGSAQAIRDALNGARLVVIVAGIGGGTGAGAAPVVAKIAKEMGALTICFVIEPFAFEGNFSESEIKGREKALLSAADVVAITSGQKLVESRKDEIKLGEVFHIVNEIVAIHITALTDLLTHNTSINIDFADLASVLRDKGLMYVGVGYGDGEGRVAGAMEKAINNPVCDYSVSGATGVIVFSDVDDGVSMAEINNAVDRVKSVVSPNANIVFGIDSMKECKYVRVTVIATGIEEKKAK